MPLSIVHWSESDFANARDSWNSLLAASAADPFFLSWEWQHQWWRAFADLLSAELMLFAVYDDERRLVGLAPLYRRRMKVHGVLTVQRLEFIGSCWRCRGPSTMRTENVDFIVRKEVAEAAGMALLRHLFDALDWDEMALGVVRGDAVLSRLLDRGDLRHALYVRHAALPPGYYIGTAGSFREYTASRGRNTRLQMFNRRKQLEKLGVSVHANGADIASFFDALNSLHRLRWGYDAFDGRRLAFNRKLAEQMAANGNTRFSLMRLGERPLSVLYNYRVGGQEYYLQGGFDEQFDRKLALGFLHLGYAIEDACNDPAIERFNLLSGSGKNTAYKERLTSQTDTLWEVQLLRPGTLKMAYKVYDALRRGREAGPMLGTAGGATSEA